MGCSGHHEHKEGDKVWYMPCESHDEIDLKKPCQAGYEQYGMKVKNGRLVPNCIPIKMSSELGEVILENLKGEVINDEWELVDELQEGSDISNEDWANICIDEKKSLFQQLKDEITAKPDCLVPLGFLI